MQNYRSKNQHLIEIHLKQKLSFKNSFNQLHSEINHKPDTQFKRMNKRVNKAEKFGKIYTVKKKFKMKTKFSNNFNICIGNDLHYPTTTIVIVTAKNRHSNNNNWQQTHTKTLARSSRRHFFNSVAIILFAMIMIVNVRHSCGLIEIQTEKEKHGKWTCEKHLLNSLLISRSFIFDRIVNFQFIRYYFWILFVIRLFRLRQTHPHGYKTLPLPELLWWNLLLNSTILVHARSIQFYQKSNRLSLNANECLYLHIFCFCFCSFENQCWIFVFSNLKKMEKKTLKTKYAYRIYNALHMIQIGEEMKRWRDGELNIEHTKMLANAQCTVSSTVGSIQCHVVSFLHIV